MSGGGLGRERARGERMGGLIGVTSIVRLCPGATVALAAASYWFLVTITNQLTPLIVGSIELHGFFYILTGINLFSFFYVLFLMPETKVSLLQWVYS